MCIETLDCVCPISIDGVNYLNNNYSQLSKKVHLFRLGTEDYGIKTNPQNLKNIEIASCSSLYPNKRVSLIASSISKLTNRYNILWHCIGDGKEYKKIKSIIKKNKIQKNVILYGRLSNKKVIDVYKKNNIRFFINVSKHEGVPVSIMEAMSFGIPCVATNVGGTSEIVDDSCGFLLNSTIDSNELSNTIEKVINLSNTEYCLLREQTRCKWLENSSAKKNYSIWGSFLTK